MYKNEFDAGEYTGVLDMKEWGKTPCLRCYFTTEQDEKLVFIAYSKYNNGVYSPSNCEIDFSQINIQSGMKFRLVTEKNSKGKTRWIDAEIIR